MHSPACAWHIWNNLWAGGCGCLLHMLGAVAYAVVQGLLAAGWGAVSSTGRTMVRPMRGGMVCACSALLTPVPAPLLLQIHMARDVDGLTFAEAINDALAPRMKLTGERAGRTAGSAGSIAVLGA